ncbi:MAG: 23S rRNA (guanosine(2251)-2'-O)-methyltransferase RlmB [Candidatus Fischerbacteria bacterium RBG_13_37_8]|uniref:23S rRNA (Guanosine(2251)-2'-O)-methyltransferase RlmB n=1 Tax=Candidatus Fischerbacteria bacterium RBG_13_37_8 TaxID=1817863 RepID=A0A1F5VUJ7_9BACT|nr:MAG: 23S rRNA (guanosine(2251)-2'-O)-methyltransferase RlmB [Candidatus Fischerbacteria bacterium RBG_13_37_8]
METADILFGHHSCKDFLNNAPQRINRIIIQNDHFKRYAALVTIAKNYGIRIDVKEKFFLDKATERGNHQGIIAYITPYAYYEVQELFNTAPEKPLFVLLDGIEDPQNLGTIVRTAAAAGIDGLIIEERRCAQITSTVMRVSSGGIALVKVARINNIKNVLPDLYQRQIPIIAASSQGQYLWTDIDYTAGAAIILGSESEGIRKTLLEKADYTVRIPLAKEMESLNVSVAFGVIIFEAIRQRIALCL